MNHLQSLILFCGFHSYWSSHKFSLVLINTNDFFLASTNFITSLFIPSSRLLINIGRRGWLSGLSIRFEIPRVLGTTGLNVSRVNPAHHSSKVDKWSSMQITGVIRMRSLKTEVCYKWYKSHVSFWKSGGLDHSFEQNFPLNLYALLCTSWHPPPWRSLNSHNSASLDL